MQAQSTVCREAIIEMPGPFTGSVPAVIYDRASDVGGYLYADQAHIKKAKDQAHAHGWYIADYYWEDEKGDNADRKEYNRLLRNVEARAIKVIIVSDMARFSRGGWERLQKIEQVEKCGARFWRLDKEDWDKPGLERFQEAFQDRAFLDAQAQKAVDNLPFAVAAKKLMGELPTGLDREFRLSEDKKSVRVVVVQHAVYAPLVRKAAQDYANGTPVQAIVNELNAGPHPNPHRKDGVWTKGTLYSVFHTPAHAGLLTWGKQKRGKHLQYQGPVLREALDCGPVIEDDLWGQVQRRLANQSKGRHMNQRGYPTQLLDSLLVCSVCGADTYVQSGHAKGHTYYQYVCSATHRGFRRCDPARISARVADEAVLRQVERLRGQPWSDAAFDAAVRSDPNEPLRLQLRTAMADVERRMAELAARVAAMQDVGPHFMEAMKGQARKLELEMQHLKDQYASIPARSHDPVKARELYETLVSVDIHQCVLQAQAKGDDVVLRDILALVIGEARIVERGSATGQAKHATWARASIKWSANVELLLSAGRLTLADDPDCAPRASLKERKREAMRRYRARKRDVENEKAVRCE